MPPSFLGDLNLSGGRVVMHAVGPQERTAENDPVPLLPLVEPDASEPFEQQAVQVGPSSAKRSAADLPPLPLLNPAWAVGMGGSEDHCGGQLDRFDSDLADQVGAGAEALDCVGRRLFERRIDADEISAMENSPLAAMLGLEPGPCSFIGCDVVTQCVHGRLTRPVSHLVWAGANQLFGAGDRE